MKVTSNDKRINNNNLKIDLYLIEVVLSTLKRISNVQIAEGNNAKSNGGKCVFQMKLIELNHVMRERNYIRRSTILPDTLYDS